MCYHLVEIVNFFIDSLEYIFALDVLNEALLCYNLCFKNQGAKNYFFR